MMRHPGKCWFTLVCNEQLSVKRVINAHNIAFRLGQGDDLVSIIAPHCMDKYFSFVMDMKRQKSVFLHEMNILDEEGHDRVMDFCCVRYDDHLLLIAVSKDMALTEELLAINHDLTNTLRTKIKEQRPVVEYMEELSELNNELINTKRELVKKNVEITRLLEKEAALTGQLEETLRAKDLLFSILAHDLRSPLANIMSLMSLVNLDEESCQEAIKQGLFSQVHASTGGALRLLEDLLQWYRYSQSSELVHGQMCHMNGILDSIYSLFQKEAQSKGVLLVMPTEQPVSIYADPNMLSTVLRNLVSNALKYTPKDGTITLSLSETQDFCNVIIEDTGIGMSDSQLDLLFSIKKNKSTPGLSGERGNGFGLVLVHDLVTKMDGTISVSSAPGKGTRFVIALPQTEKC